MVDKYKNFIRCQEFSLIFLLQQQLKMIGPGNGVPDTVVYPFREDGKADYNVLFASDPQNPTDYPSIDCDNDRVIRCIQGVPHVYKMERRDFERPPTQIIPINPHVIPINIAVTDAENSFHVIHNHENREYHVYSSVI
jgi:hypothetical protein